MTFDLGSQRAQRPRILNRSQSPDLPRVARTACLAFPALQQIAHVTGGRYFRATDTERLEEVYREISELEKTRIDLTHYRHFNELFFFPALAALLLLSAEMTLRAMRCRTVP